MLTGVDMVVQSDLETSWLTTLNEPREPSITSSPKLLSIATIALDSLFVRYNHYLTYSAAKDLQCNQNPLYRSMCSRLTGGELFGEKTRG